MHRHFQLLLRVKKHLRLLSLLRRFQPYLSRVTDKRTVTQNSGGLPLYFDLIKAQALFPGKGNDGHLPAASCDAVGRHLIGRLLDPDLCLRHCLSVYGLNPVCIPHIFGASALRRKEEIGHLILLCDSCQQLGFCIFQTEALHRKSKGKDCLLFGSKGNPFYAQLLFWQLQDHGFPFFLLTADMILVIIQEKESAFAIRPYCVAQSLGILRGNFLGIFRKYGLHPAEPVCEIRNEKMQSPQTVIAGTQLSVFTDRRLIVIGNLGTLVLIEIRRPLSPWIAAAPVHIIAQEIAAAGELDIRHGIHTFIRKLKAVIVKTGHASAHLTAGIGKTLRLIRGLKIIGFGNCIVMIVPVKILWSGRMFSLVIIEDPGPEGVSAPQRKHFLRGRRCPSPSGTGIERCADPFFHSHGFQRFHIGCAVAPPGDPLIADPCGKLPGRC